MNAKEAARLIFDAALDAQMVVECYGGKLEKWLFVIQQAIDEAVENAIHEKWSVSLVLPPKPNNPFRFADCTVIDVSFSEKGIRVECDAVQGEIDEATAELKPEVERVKVAFQRYGTHFSGCRINTPGELLDSERICTCGFQAALDAGKEEA